MRPALGGVDDGTTEAPTSFKSSRDYDEVHIVDEKSGNVNNVNMMLKTPEMPNDNDYDKTNKDGNSNSYNDDYE